MSRVPVDGARPCPRHGRALFDTVGCRSGHLLDVSPETPGARGPSRLEAPSARFGPQLGRVALEMEAARVERWIEDPRAVFPQAKMPRLPFDPGEPAGLAAYLSSLPPGPWPSEELPAGRAEDGRRHVPGMADGGPAGLPAMRGMQS